MNAGKLSHALFLAGALAVASLVLAAEGTSSAVDREKVPEIKRSRLGLYLTPQQAYAMKLKDPGGVAFFDVRTRAEAMYVGWPGDADALVPYVELPEMMTDWDDKRLAYKLEPNQDFLPEIERRLQEKGLGKAATIILICRSGDRSAKAADRLAMAGYGKVYSVVEGVEGDLAKEGPTAGQRTVNGWKNAGLPWTYQLERAKMYFPR